ncbi:MAG: 6-pyruvoyl-tetrahydropterin synthase-related protein, partial [Candidatus Xenobia bacterium]
LAVARTADAPSSPVGLNVVAAQQGALRVDVVAHALPATVIHVASLVSDELQCSPATQDLPPGQTAVRFVVQNREALPRTPYAVVFTAEYDLSGVHYLASTSTQVEVQAPASHHDYWLKVFFVTLAMALLVAVWSWRTRVAEPLVAPWVIDVLTLVLVEAFILSRLCPSLLLTPTTPTGGDMASHYFTADYLRHVMLPAGRITEWNPGNYAGFPMLQEYFPLSFLLMSGLSLAMPLQLAFKLVSVLGILLLPLAAWAMMRLMRTPFPGPALAAVFMVPFLFNTGQSVWGGNILSALAGEFSYGISLALSLIFLGLFYRGALENRYIIPNALLVFLVGFSHGYTLLFVEAVSIYLLITPTDFLRRLEYLFKVYALGFCLLAFWLVPLVAFSRNGVPFDAVWVIKGAEAWPRLLLPYLLLGLAGTVVLLTWRRALQPLGLLGFSLLVAAVLYVLAPRIGVVDVRNIPFAQVLLCLAAALCLGNLLEGKVLGWLVLALCLTGTLAWISPDTAMVTEWCRWNYSGFEAKPAWNVYHDINQALTGNFNDPRVVYEHSSKNNEFGSERAFESLPLFAGRATLEGLYMQASPSAPFVFYIQSLVSDEQSAPFPSFTYSNTNFERARSRLAMFNVRDLIVRSAPVLALLHANPAYGQTRQIGQYELWQLKDCPNHYVNPLRFQPVRWTGNDWRQTAYQWFKRDDLLDHVLVRSGPFVAADSLDHLPSVRIDTAGCQVQEKVTNQAIDIDTNWIGKPLLVRMSYHPDWRVQGADGPYPASPAFMVIVPRQAHVHLYFGSGLADWMGEALTVAGLLLVLLKLSGRLPSFSLAARIAWDPAPATRHRLLAAALVLALAVVAVTCWHVYTTEPYRMFVSAIQFKDARRYDQAVAKFQVVHRIAPEGSLGLDSLYYIACIDDLEHQDAEALREFRALNAAYPHSTREPEAEYHIGLALLRLKQTREGVEQLQTLIREHPQSNWATYAADRLREVR